MTLSGLTFVASTEIFGNQGDGEGLLDENAGP